MEKIPAFLVEFANLAGELAKSLSLNRSIGQIYGFLYLSRAPRSLEEIAEALEMSKGNASINLRTLETWGAVRSVGIRGSRRDHYEANRDLQAIALRRFSEGFTKRLTTVKELLQYLSKACHEQGNHEEVRFASERLRELQAFIAKAERVSILWPKLKMLV